MIHGLSSLRRLGLWLSFSFLLFCVLPLPQAEANPRYASLILDADTGRILDEENGDSLRHPASLTKMITLYMTFRALEQGQLRSGQKLPVSAFAAGQSPSKLGLRAGQVIAVEQAIQGLVTKSANDAAVVLAEAISGSESRFGLDATAIAQQLGMTRTRFKNASGLPDAEQVTSARDMARLALALIHHYPREYEYFSQRSFTFRGVNHANHNRLMSRYSGMDGIKTGFIRASGFNLVTSAVRNGRRLIGVVFGGQSARSRDDHMAKLLDAGFREIQGGAAMASLNKNDTKSDETDAGVTAALTQAQPKKGKVAKEKVARPSQTLAANTPAQDAAPAPRRKPGAKSSARKNAPAVKTASPKKIQKNSLGTLIVRNAEASQPSAKPSAANDTAAAFIEEEGDAGIEDGNAPKSARVNP